MLREALRIGAWNIFFILAFAGLVELWAGHWFGPMPRSVLISCFDRYVHHNYCPHYHFRRHMSAADGGEFISTYTNAQGYAVANPSDMHRMYNPKDFDVILIGDSFIQAEEMEYSKRLGPQLEKKTELSVLQVGYSSWAPAVQTNWLRANNLAPDQHVFYFVMTNDFTPSYGSSNGKYHDWAKGYDRETGIMFFEPDPENDTVELADIDFGQMLLHRSFFLSRLEEFISFRDLPQGSPLLSSDDIALLRNSCETLSYEAEKLGIREKLIFDYIVYSTPQDCWDRPYKVEVDGAVEDIKAAHAITEETGARLHVLLIAPGWAFTGENQIGKSDPENFSLREDALVGNNGLAKYLTSQLSGYGIDFIDLEPIITEAKKLNSHQFYFPLDGHWTPETHTLLSDLIAQKLVD